MNVSRRQTGFTLVELMVSMAILMFLAAISVYMYPRIQENVRVSQGAEQLQGWLLIAKQNAKSAQVPCGLRFIYDTNGLVTQCIYIRQPEDYSQGRFIGPGVDPAGSGMLSWKVARFANANLSNSLGAGTVNQYPAQAGDYLEIFGGPVHRINGNASSIASEGTVPTIYPQSTFTPVYPYEDLPLDPNTTPLDTTAGLSYSTMNPPGSNYRIIRLPRPEPGEQPLNLPYQTVIDLTQGLGMPGITVGTAGYLDLLFAPTGNVLNAAGPLICLRIRDNSGTTPPLAADTLIAVTARSGFIAAHPINPTGDPFAFAKDARDSGL